MKNVSILNLMNRLIVKALSFERPPAVATSS